MNSDGYGAIRVSYSILSAWARGDIDRAIAPYAGIQDEPNEAMIAGKKLHERWEQEVRRTKHLPRIFGGRNLEAPELELSTKKVRKLTDWCVLVGVLDVKDGCTGIDYKTGVMSATGYVNSKQHEVYQVLYPELTRFEYYCYNQHLCRSDSSRVTVGVVHLSRQTLQDGLEWILTMAAELREYLINSGLGSRLDYKKESK